MNLQQFCLPKRDCCLSGMEKEKKHWVKKRVICVSVEKMGRFVYRYQASLCIGRIFVLGEKVFWVNLYIG